MTNEERLDPPNPLPHVVLPQGGRAIGGGASANGSIVAAYRNGIGLIDEPGAMTGFLSIIGVMGLALSAVFLWVDLEQRAFWHAIVSGTFVATSLAMLRTDLLGHTHSPVLFDRAARKVHVFVSLKPAWWALWRWWPSSRVGSYDWASIRAEVVEIVQVGGAGVPRRDFALTLAVLEAPGSTKVRARFGVGLGYPWAPEPIFALWEHLRRFMAGGGPHLARGDTVYANPHEEGFWRGLGFLQPLLMPGARGWITGSDFSGAWWFTLPFSVFCLVLLPFTAACGLVRWLAIQARREPRWPPEVLASVGEPVDLAAPRVTWTQRRKALTRKQGKN